MHRLPTTALIRLKFSWQDPDGSSRITQALNPRGMNPRDPRGFSRTSQVPGSPGRILVVSEACKILIAESCTLEVYFHGRILVIPAVLRISLVNNQDNSSGRQNPDTSTSTPHISSN